jgi:hypothetical protein
MSAGRSGNADELMAVRITQIRKISAMCTDPRRVLD